jgi:hypothetical protein
MESSANHFRAVNRHLKKAPGKILLALGHMNKTLRKAMAPPSPFRRLT